MNKTRIEWPAVYLQESKVEELMYISSDNWNDDVDSRYAIGPLNEETDHYLVDSKQSVFRVSSPYMTDSGYPHFEFERVEKPEVVKLIKIRASDENHAHA